jgi:hypothetical protein
MPGKIAIVLIVTTLMSGAALAQDGTGQSGWYGYQTLALDAAAISAGALAWSHAGEVHAGRVGSPTFIWGSIAAAAWFGGAPLVHMLHDRSESAAYSFVLRLGLPFVAALVGTGLWAAGWGGCTACLYAIPPLAGVAILTPMVADAAILSREPATSPPPRREPFIVTAAVQRGPGIALAWRF